MSDHLRIPTYRKHKGSGQAVVTLAGKDHYLGKFGTESSRREYNRLIAEWLSGGHVAGGDNLTITELIALFWRHVKSYYRKNGKPTAEVDGFRTVLRLVRELYGDLTAREFSPLKLKAVRTEMLDKGWCRTHINAQFSPKESEQLRRLDASRKRTTPRSCGNRPGSNRKKRPKRKAGVGYTTASYRRAVARACEKAEVQPWTPGRLRHTAGTRIRREYGLEAAQLILGHSRADVTQVYAERDIKKALRIAAEIG